MRLTLDAVSELADGADVRKLKKFSATHKNITALDDLSPCLELHRLDLAHNQLKSISGILYCSSLTWLSVSHNNLVSLSGVQSLTGLVVLNASHNSISSCGQLGALKNLKALILNNNELTSLSCAGSLQQLNTLVLSHNHIESIEISSLTGLTKLSLAHNELREIPNTKNNTDLRELRLNGNKITSLPSSLQHNARLQVLDIGGNRITSWSSLTVLQSLTALRSVNLKGNIVSTSEEYPNKLLQLLPSLNVLDGQKVAKPLPRQLKSVSTATEKDQAMSSPACDHDLLGKTTESRKRKRKVEKKQTATIGSSSTDCKRKSPRFVLHEDDDEEEEETSSQKRAKIDDNSAFETDQTNDETFVMGDLPAPYHKEAREETRKRIVRPRGKSGVVAVTSLKKNGGRERGSSRKNRISAPTKKQLKGILYGQASVQGLVPKW